MVLSLFNPVILKEKVRDQTKACQDGDTIGKEGV